MTASRPGRRERKKVETRRRIFEAAFTLFLEKGFDATTVDDIAARADVGKGTVFNYFPKKTSILAALADDWTSRLHEQFGLLRTWRGSTRAQLDRVFQFLADLGAQNPALSRLAFAESLRRLHGAGDEQPQESPIRDFQAITRTVLLRGQERGDVRPDVDPEVAAQLIESAYFRTLARWLRDGGSPGALHRELGAKLDIIFEGLGTGGARGRGRT